ncbi:hypothetical protein BDF20DRAFT_821891 [Mycotypha africana]|uniref:uncharacterized protein n=1 Tax=Mycotypha africana TaxID=64632 RepID=UPI0023012A9F|nr:uncharacterized protein BDF20DRAFT_821891 [Mycotypha africana]KAI8975187.1 hypothetical protein BDF20DRAFT_821891 [Mycotypha africana]
MDAIVKPLPPFYSSNASSEVSDDNVSSASSSEEGTVINTPRNSEIIFSATVKRRASSFSTTSKGSICNNKKRLTPPPPLQLLKRAKSYSHNNSNNLIPPVPSLPTTTNIVSLERKIEELEQELSKRIQRESELISQIWILNQHGYDNNAHKTAYQRMSLSIEQFLNRREKSNAAVVEKRNNTIGTNTNATAIVWLYRIKDTIGRYKKANNSAESTSKELLRDIETLIEAWQLTYKMQLLDCQEQKEELEQTLDMVRKEMQMMLEELEDIKQQRIRYKAQASRLKASLDAVHKEIDGNVADQKKSIDALRALHQDAERQAVDLTRENKRQALTIASLRGEIKRAAEARYKIFVDSRKTRNNECCCQKEGLYNNDSTKNTKADELHALQIACRAAESNATIQRTRVKQLEQQQATINKDLQAHLQRIVQWLHQRQQRQCICVEKCHTFQEIAERIELEQRLWKSNSKKEMQKKFDIDLLHVHRDLRQAISRISGLEEEIDTLQLRHEQELIQSIYESRLHHDRRLHRLITNHNRKELALEKNLEVSNQKNKTLQNELLILQSHNMMMAQQLVKLTA